MGGRANSWGCQWAEQGAIVGRDFRKTERRAIGIIHDREESKRDRFLGKGKSKTILRLSMILVNGRVE